MPICHCGSSGVLKGLLRRFYKFVITKPKAEAIQEKGSRNKCAMTNFGTFYQPHVIAEGEACPRSMDCFANARNDEKYLLSNPLPKIRPQNDKKKVAFTLAEVLITLGIIGVVAAMTMPMLIAKYQKLVVETIVQN